MWLFLPYFCDKRQSQNLGVWELAPISADPSQALKYCKRWVCAKFQSGTLLKSRTPVDSTMTSIIMITCSRAIAKGRLFQPVALDAEETGVRQGTACAGCQLHSVCVPRGGESSAGLRSYGLTVRTRVHEVQGCIYCKAKRSLLWFGSV